MGIMTGGENTETTNLSLVELFPADTRVEVSYEVFDGEKTFPGAHGFKGQVRPLHDPHGDYAGSIYVLPDEPRQIGEYTAGHPQLISAEPYKLEADGKLFEVHPVVRAIGQAALQG